MAKFHYADFHVTSASRGRGEKEDEEGGGAGEEEAGGPP